MITQAKVSINAVKKFAVSVSAVKDYSTKFDSGIDCLEVFFRKLSDLSNVLSTHVEDMAVAQEKLDDKIRSIEKNLARLTEKLNNLEEKREKLESKLDNIPSTITRIDKNGERTEISNPAYEAVCEQISAVEGKISAVKAEIELHQEQLERVNTCKNELAMHQDTVARAIYSLEEKKSICQKMRAELEELQGINLRQGTAAIISLKKIEEIITSYLRVKMGYENAVTSQIDQFISQDGLYINTNTQNNVIPGKQSPFQMINKKPEYSKEEIEKHGIEFDDSGRVSVYDGKTFGGNYNTYEDRLAKIPVSDSPVNGRYDGIRGESKYIPSNRTVEGVIVKEILSRYGIDGITYRNAEPDFEVCAEYSVKIFHMTENRDNFTNGEGQTALGNFSQADIELAKVWNAETREARNDWKARDVFNYRKTNKLTWHEKCDTETMVLVRTEINSFFKHSGGCSECSIRDAVKNDGGDFDE